MTNNLFRVEEIRSLTVHLADAGRFRVRVQNESDDEDAFTYAGVYDKFDDACTVADALNRIWAHAGHKTSAEIVAFLIGPDLPS